MQIKGRVALVTGSASGMGRGTAEIMAQHGVKIVINDINQEQVDEVVKGIKEAGGEAIGIAADITKKDQVEAMFQKVVDTFGRIDILVNNAGISKDKGILKMSEADWDSVLAVDLKGVFLCCQAAIKFMREQNYGRIVNISSRAWLGGPGQANYSAAKAGVVGLTRTLALEMGKKGITVNCIPPGIIETAMWQALPEATKERLNQAQPTGKIGAPRDIARAVMFFASDEAGYITGQTMYVCGGKSLFANIG
ncbi:Acetyl-CoA acetyltransferase [Desulfosporosinus sp. Tol-M]|jgi:Dehydrogenases with different specificities (related to short-chain alcohol dehydrogenases)|nr:3-oxoacyl-ACP reductase [Desulfosporosinus sp. Tol-M]KGP76067.1 Acetyl-CoA acetyltransferase [Desulfosporosinus sp. Tol-M]